MPLPDPPADGAGGILQLVYTNAAAGVVHEFKWHVAQFEQTPVGAEHDYLYNGSGPVVPSEVSILQTFAAVGALWAPYYAPSWSLSIAGLYWQLADGEERLVETPSTTPISGTNTTVPLIEGSTKRIFFLRSTQGRRRRMWLQHLADDTVDVTTEVSPSAGGFDSRDRAWMAYLSGASGGAVVAPDGKRFEAVCDVRRWWQRPLEPITPVGSTRDTFIGPSPPADPQDAWFWLDTSTDAPYALYIYSMTVGEWLAVATTPRAPYMVVG